MTEEAHGVNIFGLRYINAIVEWLGTPVPFTILPGCLQLTKYWSLNCVGKAGVTTKPGLCKLNIEFVSEEETPLGMAPSLSVPLTFLGVW